MMILSRFVRAIHLMTHVLDHRGETWSNLIAWPRKPPTLDAIT
jgi:hypothetical protein